MYLIRIGGIIVAKGLRNTKKSEAEAKEVETKEKAKKEKTPELETPEVKEAEVEKTETTENEVEVSTTPAKELPKVRVKPNKDIRTYIGSQWYNLKAGVVTSVPANVKEILRKAGNLDTL